MTKKLLFLFLAMGSTIVMAQNLTITTTVCSDASSVRMTGPWWGWDIGAGPEAAQNPNGTWTFTFNPAPTADMEYLLVVDGFQENLLNSNLANQNWSCTPATDQATFANRMWEVGSGNVSGIYYGTCNDCSSLVIYGCTNPTANNYNPNADENDGSCLFGINLPIDFEGSNYSFVDFEGGASEIVPNPYPSGINTSQNVVKHIRNVGSNYAGTFVASEPIDFSSDAVLSLKVYSPEAPIPVLFKLDSENATNTQIIQTLEVANEWVEMQYDFGTQPSNVFTKLVVIFNPGSPGDGSVSSTYYFDDIQFAEEIIGCTDPLANNYNPDASVDDGQCFYNVPQLNITINPCMDVDSVRLTGLFWGWSSTEGPIATKNSNGTWTFTFDPAPTEDMEYLLVVDGVVEDLVTAGLNSGDWSCTPISDYSNYANRLWEVGSGVIQDGVLSYQDVTDVYYGSCTGCGNDFNIVESINQSLVYPNPVADKFRLNTNVSSLLFMISMENRLSQ